MSETSLPPRRALYFLNQAPATALTAAQLDALDHDPEGIALVKAIHDRKAQA
jgi:hypothetical protein